MTGADDGVTENDFLGGALSLRQPARGVRAGADGIFLAASVTLPAQAAVLDVGTGTGVVALCLARRCPDVRIDGLELQPELAGLAADNVIRNGMQDRVRIVIGDLADPPDPVHPNGYDAVVSNPPYFPAAASPSPDPSRRAARSEGGMDLGGWVRGCLRLVKSGGIIAFVFRADRLDVLLATLYGRAGDLVVYPLWPRAGQVAKIVIVQARKGGRGPLVFHPGLVLHDEGGHYTPEAEAVLRTGQPLPF